MTENRIYAWKAVDENQVAQLGQKQPCHAARGSAQDVARDMDFVSRSDGAVTLTLWDVRLFSFLVLLEALPDDGNRSVGGG